MGGMSMRWARAAPKTATLESAQVIDFRDGVLSEYAETDAHEIDSNTTANLRRAAVLRSAALPPTRDVVATQAAAAGLVRMAAPEGGSAFATVEHEVEDGIKIGLKMLEDAAEATAEDGYLEILSKRAESGTEHDAAATMVLAESGVKGTANAMELFLRWAGGLGWKVHINKETQKAEVEYDKDGGHKRTFNVNIQKTKAFESLLKWWEEKIKKFKIAAKNADKAADEIKNENQHDHEQAMFNATQLQAILPGVIAEEVAKENQLSGSKFSTAQLEKTLPGVIVKELELAGLNFSEAHVFAAVCDSFREFNAKSQKQQLSEADLQHIVHSTVRNVSAAPSTTASAAPERRGNCVTVSSRPPGNLLSRLRAPACRPRDVL